MEHTRVLNITIVNSRMVQRNARVLNVTAVCHFQKIVEALDESHTPLALTSCISTVISLGLDGEHMCYILSRVCINMKSHRVQTR